MPGPKKAPICRRTGPFWPYLSLWALVALGRQMGVPTYFFRSFDRVDDFTSYIKKSKKKSARAVTSYAHLKVRPDTLIRRAILLFRLKLEPLYESRL